MPLPSLAARLFTGLGLLFLLLLFVWVLAWLFQRRLIYLPDARSLPAPESLISGSRSVTLFTDDGLELAAWLVPGDPSPALERRNKTPVIVFHGNAGNRFDRAPLAALLKTAGYSVLLVDYRGYGGNLGAPSEEGLLKDAQAAYRFCAQEPTLDERLAVYYGASLGSGVAVALALEQPPAGVILRSPFTSMVDLARHHYPLLPSRLLLRDRFPSVERIGAIEAPLLFLVGEGDRIIPAANSRHLFEAAPEPKTWLGLPGADHNDYELLAGPGVARAMVEFLS